MTDFRKTSIDELPPSVSDDRNSLPKACQRIESCGRFSKKFTD